VDFRDLHLKSQAKMAAIYNGCQVFCNTHLLQLLIQRFHSSNKYGYRVDLLIDRYYKK